MMLELGVVWQRVLFWMFMELYNIYVLYVCAFINAIYYF